MEIIAKEGVGLNEKVSTIIAKVLGGHFY